LVDFLEILPNLEYHSAATMKDTRGDVTEDGCTVVANFVAKFVANTIVFLGFLLCFPLFLIFYLFYFLYWCYDPPAPSSLENEQQHQQPTHQLSVPMGSDDVPSTNHPDSVDSPPAPSSLENAQQQQLTHQFSASMGSDDVRTTINMHARITLGRILKPVEDKYSLTSTDTDNSPAPHACLDTDEAVPVKSINEESDTECHNCALEEQQTYTQPPIVLSADFGDNEVLAIEELACTICLIEYQHGDEIQRNGFLDMSKSCDHIFHPECITAWIRTSCNAKCPCCRRPFLVPTPPV
jgi:hypothetical protein